MTNPITAILFDLDGVLTDTAEYHFRAWKRLADEIGVPFTREDNEALRGVSRRESLLLLLKGRPADEASLTEWMDRKNQYYVDLIEQVTPDDLLPGVADLLAECRLRGVKMGVVSASRNAPSVLESLGIAALMDVVITGASELEEGNGLRRTVRAKPAPDIFLAAARALHLSPGHCLVIEDAAAGIEGAIAAGMVTVGIGPADRVGRADRVIPDLNGVDLETLLSTANRRVVEPIFDPQKQAHRETIFTIGNGYLGTRGALEEGFPGESRATLVHGIWDDAPVVFTELANSPDWTALDLWIDGAPFRMDRGNVRDYVRYLDLRSGELVRRLQWTPDGGAPVTLTFRRVASLADPHALLLSVSVEALHRPVTVKVRARLDSHVENQGLLHWHTEAQEQVDDAVVLSARTRHTGKQQVEAMRLQVESEGSGRYADCPGSPGIWVESSIPTGQVWTAHKLVSIFTDRDTDDPRRAALEHVTQLAAAGVDTLFAANRTAWDGFWAASDVVIEGDDEADLATRHAIFQLRIAASATDERVSIGAKSLSGFGYRGHAFWDTETFILPFFTFTQPHLARNLLMYRWHTIGGARRKAAENGFTGAQFAWESAETGDEVTPRWVPSFDGKDLVRIWCGDIELHITADIAYAIHQYWQVTGDDAFMIEAGAAMILESARFWESRAEPNTPTPGQYSISDVIGPDEYHDHVDNNAFTNQMAAWHLETAIEIGSWLADRAPEQAAQLADQLDLGPKRFARWREIAQNLVFHHDAETGLIEQFDGFFKRKEVDWPAYADRTKSMQVLLGIEGANEHQVLKQPDVLLLFNLLPDRFGAKEWAANWAYYEPRTDHTYGSSLGPSMHAWTACVMGEPERAYEHFMRAARADLQDVRGNAGDGMHIASSGGIWQALVFGFAGFRLSEDGYTTRPQLPRHWRRLRFTVTVRGQRHVVDLRGEVGTGD